MEKYYEQFEHTGDIGIYVYANSIVELFENAAKAMFDLITDLNQVHLLQTQTIEITAMDQEELLVNWLSGLNFLFQTKFFLGHEFHVVTFTHTTLTATVTGETRHADRHPIDMEIKAVTFHNLKIEQTANGWVGRIIFDI